MLNPDEIEWYRSRFNSQRRQARIDSVAYKSSFILAVFISLMLILEASGQMDGFIEWMGAIIHDVTTLV